MREEMDRLVADAQSLLHPCTIVRTRYRGAHQRGRWAAFRCRPEQLPERALGDDMAASAWWHGEEAGWVGLGASPDQALRALVKRWAERGCRECHGLGTLLVDEDLGPVRRICGACAGRGRDEPVRCPRCGARLRSTQLADHHGRCPRAPNRGQDADR